jgi:ferredoxin-NADP reductase/Na+-translocating ferredoxin:NAD+ oxidoreductase RnfD subunit
MIQFIDNFLNKITMYRLVLYVLSLFFVVSVLLSLFDLLPYSPIYLFASAVIILAVSWLTNELLAYLYKAPTNVESVYITALILFFIITPLEEGQYSQFFTIAIFASVIAMASKYIFAIGKKHIWNPAAIAMVIAPFAIHQSASWWVADIHLTPFVIIGGLLSVKKIKRFDLVLGFVFVALISVSLTNFIAGSDISNALRITILYSPIYFFAFIMLTEPQTTPPTKWRRISYGAIVGVFFAPLLDIGSFYSSPELALVIGNIFAYMVSPKEKLVLKLKEKIKIANDTFDFVFHTDEKMNFKPGEYMEWTLKHKNPDARGNRRYFTLASSPTENEIRLGVKFYEKPSSFKAHLMSLPYGEKIVASSRAGDFTLPSNSQQGLVFIAGGIGITPFRSMIQYLLDKKERRPITLLYSNMKVSDIAYKDVFDRAEKELGIKTVYTIVSAGEQIESGMRTGLIDMKFIKEEVPDFMNKIFYISGPHGMVDAFKKTLKTMGIPKRNIKIDFFPGFA